MQRHSSRIDSVVNVGDSMKVLVIDVDEHDRVKLSRRRALEELGIEDDMAPAEGEDGGEREERSERSDRDEDRPRRRRGGSGRGRGGSGGGRRDRNGGGNRDRD